MEPNANPPQHGFELPAPQAGETAGMPNELPPIGREQNQAPLAPMPGQPLPPVMPMQPVQASPPITPVSTTPQVADDVDLIEKEWVEKAKAIVSQTRNDPHAQNKEMNRFKADYLKKRYNKEIKLEEA